MTTAVRTLHERLPTLLASPLPQDILSPQITLHLFPSTHPHLPTVSGRIPYVAALWTAPIAWGSIPVIGNVRLEVLSERMVKGSDCGRGAGRNERLVVKWRTCSGVKTDGPSRVLDFLSRHEHEHSRSHGRGQGHDDDHFVGLFVFEFSESGRLLKHTIEHADEARFYDRCRVVDVTDWLLGKVNGRTEGRLAWCEGHEQRHRKSWPSSS